MHIYIHTYTHTYVHTYINIILNHAHNVLVTRYHGIAISTDAVKRQEDNLHKMRIEKMLEEKF